MYLNTKLLYLLYFLCCWTRIKKKIELKTNWKFELLLKENATVFPYSNMFFPQFRQVDMYLSRLSPGT